MVNEAPDTPPRRPLRPTRRGRLVLFIGAVLVVAAAVLVPLLTRGPRIERTRSLVIPEGWRTSQVYEAVDKSLAVEPGTTEKAAGTSDLPLPAAAKGNPEGYLFPATYPVTSDTTPQGLLRYMADTAVERFGADHIAAGAQRNGVSVYQTVTIAAIVQAEADTGADMGKVARVIYNRLT